MDITIREVKTKRDLRRYLYLPEKIHKNHKNWVHPIYIDERAYYNPLKNENFSHCDTVLFLAFRGGIVVGRIMGIINHRYNDAKSVRHGRFNYLETYDDQEVALALLRKVEAWAKDRGMMKMIGPFGFSDKDPQGYLTDGFDQPVVIAAHANFPYIVEFLKEAGYSKEVDLVVYKVPVPEEDPDFYKKISERTIRNNPDLRLLEFARRKNIRPFVVPVLELLNRTFKDIFGFAPMTEKEMREFANRYLLLIHPELVKIIVDREGKPVAFVIGMEDISAGVRKCRGRLIPFGILQVFYHARQSKQITLLLGGIDEQYRGRGLDTLMGIKMLASARKLGKAYFDSHLELETNRQVRAEMEKMSGVVYKKYRVFSKDL